MGKVYSNKHAISENLLCELDLGATAGSVMTDCEKFGIVNGCQKDCP